MNTNTMPAGRSLAHDFVHGLQQKFRALFGVIARAYVGNDEASTLFCWPRGL